MKVIFTQEVIGAGHRDEVREVASGYAINYLFAKGLAVRATPELLAALAQRSQIKQKASSKELTQAKSWAQGLANRVVTMSCQASSAGKLYAAVKSSALTKVVAEQLKLPLTTEQVMVKEHLKTIGDHEVMVKLHPEVEVKIILRLIPTT